MPRIAAAHRALRRRVRPCSLRAWRSEASAPSLGKVMDGNVSGVIKFAWARHRAQGKIAAAMILYDYRLRRRRGRQRMRKSPELGPRAQVSKFIRIRHFACTI